MASRLLEFFAMLFAHFKTLVEGCDPQQWGIILFAAMSVEAMFVIVVGMSEKVNEGWDWKLSSVYIMWIITTVIFVWIKVGKTETFVLHTILYLFSVAVAFWFLCAVLKIGSDAVPLYIPICTDIGIFLGYGLEQIWKRWHAAFRQFWHMFLEWLPRPELVDSGGPLLPLTHTPTTPPEESQDAASRRRSLFTIAGERNVDTEDVDGGIPSTVVL